MTAFLFSASAVDYPEYKNIYVNDFADILDAESEAILTRKLEHFRKNKDTEFTVVTVQKMSNYGYEGEIEEFATNLFNEWGVGHIDRDDGIMMLVAIKDRQMRIEVGSGYGSNLNNEMQNIINNDILPYFKKDQFDAGISVGARSVISFMNSYKEPIGNRMAKHFPEWVPEFVVILILIVIFFAGFILAGFIAIATPIYLITILFRMGSSAKKAYRNRAIECKSCNKTTKKASKFQRENILSKGQLLEHMLGSVIFKTWHCQPCNKTYVRRYDKNWSQMKYRECPVCEFCTLKTDEIVLESATKFRSGLAKRVSQCMHCDYDFSEEYSIGIQRETSRGSRSSKSSPSSFGGGSSSGGGASGRW